ncbi:MAG: penicillin-binding protein 1A [Pseudomonadales bacterium]|nr:penicillin-binding protein 1A [Pseudomonadales bacterium]
MTKFFKYTTYITIAGISSLLLSISGAYLYLSPNLPDVEVLTDIQLQIPLRIYSSDGQLIGEFGDKRRTPIHHSDVPKKMTQAFLAAEDDQFYNHHGISIKGFSRAVFQKLTGAAQQTGGSTITQQVAKNYFLSPEKTIKRKLTEIFLALQMERQLSKDQIMELYVNKIFLGHRSYGIVAAAQVYYGKPISELSTAQFAMIAGLPKAPSRYNPITNPERAKIRRDWILSRMLKLNYITAANYDEAINEALSAERHNAAIDVSSPYPAEMARRYALKKFGDKSTTDGYRIITTLNAKLQKTAQDAIKKGLHAYDLRHGLRPVEAHFDDLSPENKIQIFKKHHVITNIEAAIVTNNKNQQLTAELKSGEEISLSWKKDLNDLKPYINESSKGKTFKKSEQIAKIGDIIRIKKNDDNSWSLTQIPVAEAALISLSPKDGSILALVGGYDFYKSKFNRATQANRQVGSVIKPLIYSAALQHGMTAATIINDAPVVFDDAQLEGTWRPKNSGSFNGPTRLRKALYLSRNLVSIRILRQTGISKTIDYIAPFGLNRDLLPRNLSLALGTASFTPLDIATAYATFANGGYKINPYLIAEIYDGNNQLIYQASPAIACDECLETSDSDVDSADSPLSQLPTPEAETGTEVPKEPPYTPTPPSYAKRIMTEQIAFLMGNILQDVTRKGTGWKAGRDLKRNDIGGKTGTTNGPTDAWFSGFHPNIVTTTWLGFDDNAMIGRNEFGGSAAMPIWIDFMQVALKNQPRIDREPPTGIVSVLIDKDSGKRAQPGADNTMFEYIQEELLETIPEEESHSVEEDFEMEELF